MLHKNGLRYSRSPDSTFLFFSTVYLTGSSSTAVFRVFLSFVDELEADMGKFVTRISSIEIPVTDRGRSVAWYTSMLGLAVTHQDGETAMLVFDATGVPGLYLVQTDSEDRLKLLNTKTRVEQIGRAHV